MSVLNRPTHLMVARKDSDVLDKSFTYGPGWHAPLPTIIPGMVVKIGLRGPLVTEWPWAIVQRVLESKVLVVVDYTVRPEQHGVVTGAELEIAMEHIHMVWVDEESSRVH